MSNFNRNMAIGTAGHEYIFLVWKENNSNDNSNARRSPTSSPGSLSPRPQEREKSKYFEITIERA